MLFQRVCPRRGVSIHLFLFILVWVTPALAYLAPPQFDLTFSPSTIGPGSTATLRYTIVNLNLTPLTNLAFSNSLPSGMDLAAPTQADSECGGTLTAPPGGTTVSLSGGTLGAAATCTITVDVTAATPGEYLNITGSLTADAIDDVPATASGTLVVASDRPGFSKSFTPSTLSLGGRLPLTFTINNSINPNPATSLEFTDSLPIGMVVADPANVSTTCSTLFGSPPNALVTAVPGSDTISLGLSSNDFATVPGNSNCTVTVDVQATAVGLLGNTSGELTSADGIHDPRISSGKASAVLEVTADTLHLDKSFLNDPVTPGGTVELQFTLTNFHRTVSATKISFSDDLAATLPGLAATGLPQIVLCGADSQVSADNNELTFTGATLGPGETCSFRIPLTIPPEAATGSYPNSTSSLSARMEGEEQSFAGATATLFINTAPTLTKEFLDDPVGAGSSVTLEYMVRNSSTTSAATAIAFLDELTTFLPFPLSVVLPPTPDPPCGAGSSLTVVSMDQDRQGLSLTGGSLAPAGTADDSCTFTVQIAIPADMPSGTYLSNSGNITATVDKETQTGRPASDTLTIVGGPTLSTSFTGDPVLPGDTVTLEFTLSHDEAAMAAANDIAFSDDLTAALAGLTAVGLPQNDICGTGSQLSGTTTLSVSGATLAPGESCSFSVLLQVPASEDSFGIHTNVTSTISATINGVPVTGNPAADDLLISPLIFSKTFIDEPVIPGDMVTLEFTLENTSPTATVTNLYFIDAISDTLSGLTIAGDLPESPCGPDSLLLAPSDLIFAGGQLPPLTSCTFRTTLAVPASTQSSTYINTTSMLSATINGSPFTGPPARDELVVNANLLQLTKSFSTASALPGGTVPLEFTLTNHHASEGAESIAFSDDLEAALPGLTATGLPIAACGGILDYSDGPLTLSNGKLAPEGSCSFRVDLQIPDGVPAGTVVTNNTSQVTGTIKGLPVTGDPASADLEITFLTVSKSFAEKTRAGDTATLTFTLENSSPASTTSNLQFSDDLKQMFPGLVATGLPVSDICGAGSLLSGTEIITLSGATLLPDQSCTFPVTLQLPMSAPHGFFLNTTSFLTVQGEQIAGPATAILEVDNDRDDDTIMDQDDNCPEIANAGQANNDGDSQGDLCDPDDDNDSVPDTTDNCPFIANSSQADFDGDGKGNPCDQDDDNDIIPDTWEMENGLNPLDPADATLDNDQDGFTNLEEYDFGSDPNLFDSDINHNGVPDGIDGIRGTRPSVWHLLNHQDPLK